MVLSLVTENVAFTPPKVTLLAWVNPLPVMVTGVPTVPLLTLSPVTAGSTLKLWLPRSVPVEVTMLTTPVSAPAGTFAVRKVSETTLKLVAGVPPNETLLAPVKLWPRNWTVVPTLPCVAGKRVNGGRPMSKL